jgi:hypothetical protein
MSRHPQAAVTGMLQTRQFWHEGCGVEPTLPTLPLSMDVLGENFPLCHDVLFLGWLDLSIDMFHDMFLYRRTGISPDLDGKRATKMKRYVDPARPTTGPDMFHDMFVHWSGLRRVQGSINPERPRKL